MDKPSWNDTLRASFATCLPCFSSSSSGDSDTENERIPGPGVASYAIRRARADELEGLLADTHADADDAADADAISLHSHLGPRGRRRIPPRTPRHIALWGFNLFGRGRVELPLDAAGEPLHRPQSANATTDRAEAQRRRSAERTAGLLARAAADAGDAPTPLSDADIERRARRRARKEMRRLAAAVAQQDEQFALQVDSPLTPSAHRGIPAPFLPSPAPHPEHGADALAQMRAQDDEDAADLDGGMYARLTPRAGAGGGSRSSGRSSNSGSGAHERGSAGSGGYEPVGAPHGMPPKKTKKRSKKSKSSATSSTLASPRQEDFGAFAPVFDGAQGEFDGTPGGLDAGFGARVEFEGDQEFDGTPGGLGGVAREALPSSGLSKMGRGLSFSVGGGTDMGAGAFFAGA
ncbi:hypothetical protein B0H15DRAFT_799191 [Mycena belliarum]|uniref:Uncharacterized protein n=1 Tax=Mycena belliarum TaxID=1033014 RepID=A0AAD6XR68_9AGAR|nr:hypothetical protein B0H15DRAFT_799191 [Mycena belliae]